MDQERTMNLYVEIVESRGGSTPIALFPTPGVSLLSEASGAPGKANFVDPVTGRHFLVVGNKFIEADMAGTQTEIATLAVDSNPATISGNGAGAQELFITSGGNGYLFDTATDTFSTIAALAGKATMGDQLNGTFLALQASTGTVFFSDVEDGATWDTSVNFFQRNSASDPWIAMRVLSGLIFLLGAETGDTYYDSGASPVPYVPTSTGIIQWGIAAPFSLEVASGALYWLANTVNGRGQVLKATGARPEVVSHRALEYIISQYGEVSDAIGDTYTDAGHTFYVLTFLSADATWVFDPSVPPPMAWHERGTWLSDENRYSLWRPMYHAFAYGRHTMLDLGSGGLYEMSIEFGTDVEELAIRRLRRSPALMKENLRLYYPCFELGLEPGLGLQSGQGSDPMVVMRQSNDGGKTWGNQRWQSAGLVGQYGKRVRWLACGSGRQRVFEVSFSDPIPWRLTDAWLPDFENANRRAA